MPGNHDDDVDFPSLVEVPEYVVDLLAVDHAVLGRRHRPHRRPHRQTEGAVVHHARHTGGVVVGDGGADAHATAGRATLYEVHMDFVVLYPSCEPHIQQILCINSSAALFC